MIPPPVSPYPPRKNLSWPLILICVHHPLPHCSTGGPQGGVTGRGRKYTHTFRAPRGHVNVLYARVREHTRTPNAEIDAEVVAGMVVAAVAAVGVVAAVEVVVGRC